jgi:2-oxoisovalerate dehydrogenase E2 component (dihydrolipoyl transacylase)
MPLRLPKLALQQLRTYNRFNLPSHFPKFHTSTRALAVKPFLLADIGEGITECEIIQWFVEPEATVEEWDKLCEVQSDKASVEITSKFNGVIKKLHYDAGDMARVGKPLVDIDIQGDIKDDDLAALSESGRGEESPAQAQVVPTSPQTTTSSPSFLNPPPTAKKAPPPTGKHTTLATPAVRHLTKELNVRIEDVTGTGRDGRVLKEDVYQFAKDRDTSSATPISSKSTFAVSSGPQEETICPLSNTQYQMFKTMTKSLAIPHFLYADEIDFSGMAELRIRLNKGLARAPINDISKLSFLPFIIKAVSMSLHQYPSLNARVEFDSSSSKPALVMRSQHNIGVAMDTPTGLIVPVIKNVSSLNVLAIAAELNRLQALAVTGKLTTQDLSGGTITVSNIGSIGGTYVSPVIVEKEVAILGVGKIRTIPSFGEDGQVVKKQVCNFSWSADHRVIDGATMARAAEVVRGFVEDPDSMVMHLH